MEKYKLFGHELSLFSRKLEAAMIFYDLPFEFLAQDLNMNQRAGTHQIPVLQTPENWVIADTTPIMQMLDSRVESRALCGQGAKGFFIRLVEEYLDEWVARTMVHYRWHYKECADFAAIKLGNGNKDLAAGIAQWGPRACRATGTESEHQQKHAELEYECLLRAANQQLQVSRYLFGDRPSAIDAIFLGGLRGHTYADPIPKALVEAFPNVISYLENQSKHWDGSGEHLDLNAPGEFVTQVLELIPETYLPFVLANRKAVEEEAKAFHCEIYGEEVSFLKRLYPEQSRQMLVTYFNKLPEKEKEQVRALLEAYKIPLSLFE